jgi:prevent-host-death family protein
MQSVTMLDFRKRADQVLKMVRKGQRFVLTYRGKPVARLEPLEPTEIGDDPIYDLDELASHRAKPLSNREMDSVIYGK